ncbi:hypothetical protein [Halarcobacter sp.]|uniref:hypothetical protein n=1 Tax=Halarcobacter sp. TaxID=2321133 RepID=UPI003B004D13
MQITLSGTAFKSYEVNAQHRTKEELSKENLSFDNTLTKTNQSDNITYQTTNENENTTNIVFTDPANGNHVQVALDNSTIDRLKRNFSEDDFFQRENGDIRLNAKAEAFVSGWFADIAYKREFLSSDVNNDGKLTEEEYLNTYNAFGIKGTITYNSDDISINEKVDNLGYGNYASIDETIYRTGIHVKSLDDELNYTLNADKDFDGEISLEEAYTSESTIENKVKANIGDFFSLPENQEKGELASFFSDAINFVLDALEENKKNKDGRTNINEEQWAQIQKRHNLLITESLKQDFERKREKIEDIYA